jgi:hypothetical protein
MKINRDKLYVWGILVLGLFVSRFVDFSILFSLGNREHHFLNLTTFYQRNSDSIYYKNIGFSSHENAKEILSTRAQKEKKDIIIICFYDFICPIRYLIYNKDTKAEVHLPWIKKTLDTGLTEINIYKFEYFQVIEKNKTEGFFNPVIGAPWQFLYKIEKEYHKALYSDKLQSGEFNACIDYFAYGDSIFIKEIYIFYLYLPLVGILILSRKYNIHLAYLYFFLLLVLFAPKFLIGYAPGLGLIDGVNEIPIIKIVFPVIITVYFGIFFIRNIRVGIKFLKEKRLDFKEKIIILYFLLLPLLLRF